MSRQSKAKEFRCERCSKVFTSLMRLQHHIAAEHAPRTSRDIPTTRGIPHRPKSVTPAAGLVHST